MANCCLTDVEIVFSSSIEAEKAFSFLKKICEKPDDPKDPMYNWYPAARALYRVWGDSFDKVPRSGNWMNFCLNGNKVTFDSEDRWNPVGTLTPLKLILEKEFPNAKILYYAWEPLEEINATNSRDFSKSAEFVPLEVWLDA